MNPQELINIVVALEQDFAAFYERIEKEDHFQKIRDVLEYMHKHSAIHAELIRNHLPEASVPKLNLEPLQTLHTRIKSVLFQQLMDVDDLNRACEQLAQAEALIGQAYTVIAAHCQKVAAVYTKLEHRFKALADDEMQHHDQLLKQAPGAPETDSALPGEPG